MMDGTKGISPLIASVLLIAFTVAIATIVFSFLSTTVKQTTTSTANKTTEALECSAASINIDDVYISGTSAATVRVIVKNTGFTNGLSIISANVYNKTGVNFSTSDVPLTGFDKGETATLTFTNVNMSAGCPTAFSKVIIATSCGGVSDTFDGTPKCS
jgi:flagellin-like protein